MNLLREYIMKLLGEADIHGARVDMYFGTGGDSGLYDELTSLRFPLTVYRGLRLKSDEETDFNRLGKSGEGDHWSTSRKAAVDFARGFSSSARKFGDPVLVTGQIVSSADVDWQSTVDLNREYPNEAEIVAYKVSNPQIHSTGEEIRYHEIRKYIRALLIEVGGPMPQIQPESIIYCDMDGVLVNFESGAVSLINGALDGEYVLGRGADKILGKLHTELGEDWRAQTGTDLRIKPVRNFMFAMIAENPGDFFGALPPLADGVNQLWPYLNSTGHLVKLLTAPVMGKSGAPTAGEGKEMWAMENLDPHPQEVILSPARQKVGSAISGGIPNVLVDDKVSTIQSWNDAGGIGILHVPGGSSATISRLQELGL